MFFFAFFMGGCATSPLSLFTKSPETKKEEAKLQIAENSAGLNEKVRRYNTVTKEILENAQETPEVVVAHSFAEENERILGIPIEKIDALAAVQEYKDDKEKWENKFASLIKENTFLLKEKEDLNISLTYWKARAENNQTHYFKNFLQWISGFGLGGIVLLIIGVIFCPTIAIPLITRFVALLMKFIPSVVGFLGVVGKEAYDQVIIGVQKIKDEFETNKKVYSDEDKININRAIENGEAIYTSSEIKQIVKKHLKDSQKFSTRELVNSRKNALKKKNNNS